MTSLDCTTRNSTSTTPARTRATQWPTKLKTIIRTLSKGPKTDNDQQTAKLRTAILGLNDKGLLLLDLASASEHFQIVALGDRDTNLVEKTAERLKIEPFDDYRQLVIQNDLDCLLVAEPLYIAGEFLRAAIKKKFNILKFPPLARDFEEAEELVKLAQSRKINFAVANTNYFSQANQKLREVLKAEPIENIFMINIQCCFAVHTRHDWHIDPALAGGGVLLRNCCETIDELIANFGVASQVYSVNTNSAVDKQQRVATTEDSTTVTMKFSDTLTANLIANRTIGGRSKQIKIFAKDKIYNLTDNSLSICDSDGKTIDEFKFKDTYEDRLKLSLDNFAMAISNPEEEKLTSPAGENLNTMALIEAAYLSAKTTMPEQPNRIYQMSQQTM